MVSDRGAKRPGRPGIERPSMFRTTHHLPEYVIEAVCLALFMVAAAGFAILLNHPRSPVAAWRTAPLATRALMGIAMGGTAASLIYSPLGKRSGAHMNPAVTLAFLRLGKIAPGDAVGYVVAQFVGGTLGIVVATRIFRGLPADPSVNYVATEPGAWGAAAAFVAEAAIAFAMMVTVLTVSNTPRVARFTGVAAGILVAAYITLESPLSGMSMNPARTLGSNLLAHAARSLWIYFTAPPLGMWLAAELLLRRRGPAFIRCAKLHHTTDVRCIFRCGYGAARTEIV
jgi:aquaporin Z